MRKRIGFTSAVVLVAFMLGTGAWAQVDGCPEVTVPLISQYFSTWPPSNWSITGTYPNDCPWDSNVNLDTSNYTGGTGQAAMASSLNCVDQSGTIRELMGPPLTVIGFPSSLDMTFMTDWEPYCGNADARTEATCQQGRVVFHLDHQSDSYPLVMLGGSFTGSKSVHLASYPSYDSFRVGFQYQGNTSFTDEWWQIDNVQITATYELCNFDLGFEDDFGRSEVCVIFDLTQSNESAVAAASKLAKANKPENGVASPTLGAFSWTILKGNGAGNTYYGWANVQYGPGYIRMSAGPDQGMAFSLVYYTNVHRATATFSNRNPTVSSALYDANTQNDEIYCGRQYGLKN